MTLLFKMITIYFNSLSRISPKVSAKQAFNLFAYPFKAKLKPKQQDFLKKSKMFNIRVNDKNIQCYKWGNGNEKVLFVHGWQSHSYRWKTYIEALDQTKYSIYAFDAPGHGNSGGKICNIPLYEQSIEALIKKIGDIQHWVGHSIGSFAIASYLFHNNYSVQSYISLASPLNANEFLNDFTSKIALSTTAKSNLRKYFKTYTTYDVEHYSQENFAEKIKAIKILIIHDKDDKSTPVQNATKIYSPYEARNLNVMLQITEGLGHSLRSDNVVKDVMKCIEN